MKTKIYFTTILVISVLAFFSCDKEDSDTTKPMIDLHEPAEGQALLIGSEKGVHFEMDLSDDVMLKSYKIDIHNNFDHHSHGGTRAEKGEFHSFLTVRMTFPVRRMYMFIIMT